MKQRDWDLLNSFYDDAGTPVRRNPEGEGGGAAMWVALFVPALFVAHAFWRRRNR